MNAIITHIKSEAEGQEIRYVLRSIERNTSLTPIIIGDIPDYYTGPAIQMKRLAYCNERNYIDAQAKLIKAAEILESYVWWMDDIFALRPVEDDFFKLPLAACKRDRDVAPLTGYNRIKIRTFHKLRQLGREVWEYGTHMPFFFESNKLLDLQQYGWGKAPVLLTEELYFNFYYDQPTILNASHQYRIKRNHREGELKRLMEHPPLFLNCVNGTFSRYALPWLSRTYGDKSKWEK
ncbi:MAG: hypothetical protein BIFFINMI_02388 [Phycisphaerae bacterium]|nr:hypothetical protein [Phycisphaerae bacterium]